MGEGGYVDLRHPDDRRATARQRTFGYAQFLLHFTVLRLLWSVRCFHFPRVTFSKGPSSGGRDLKNK